MHYGFNIRQISAKDADMSGNDNTTSKIHYICQTYVQKPGAAQSALGIGKQFQYTSASQAQERAEREYRSNECVGADAYMVTEDPNSGEVSAPKFLVRLGSVPEFDEF